MLNKGRYRWVLPSKLKGGRSCCQRALFVVFVCANDSLRLPEPIRATLAICVLFFDEYSIAPLQLEPLFFSTKY